jgi:hypothetical protein
MRDSFVGFGTAEDMVVEAHFPEALCLPPAELKSSAGFHHADKLFEVRG